MFKTKKLSRFIKAGLALALSAVMSFSTVATADAAALGIDVSKYQGGINWGAVASSGVSYAFIKVGSTKSGVDPAFAANVMGAQSVGIRTGAYIYSYATSVEAAVNEANLVLQWVEGYNINFPIAFDIEDRTQAALDPNTVTAMCNAFCDVIAAAGYHPIVYTYANFYRAHITGALRYDKWIAQYSGSCDIPGHAIWQSSSSGAIAGIGGRVDLNYMYKDFHSYILPVGFAQRGNDTYIYNNYRIQFGWVEFPGARYHTDITGRMDKGWFTDESGTYYLAADGHALVGPNQIENDRYYFDEMGRIQSGWITLADNQYFYDPANGCRMVTGWYNDANGRHYLFPADGHLVKGPINIENKDYLFDAKGNMLIDWQTVNGLKFYYNPADGAMVRGWIGDLANRYYLSTLDGHMVTGVQSIDGQTYYFDADGRMQLGWQKINNVEYYFNPADGTMVKGLIQGVDGIYGTSETDGHKLANEAATIAGIARCFDADGRVVINAPYTIGNTTFICDANGVATPATPVPAQQ